MEATKEVQEQINQLQLIEQNIHAMALQKQQFQAQLFELESALKELETADTAYKIVGNIMVSSKKEDLKKYLLQKKEIVDLRLSSMAKQEKELKEKEEKIRDGVLGSLKK